MARRRIEHQVAVDLVRDDDRVARQLRELRELGAREHRAAGVLRIAEIGEARGSAQDIGVEYPAAPLQHERHVRMRTRRQLDRALEVLIYRARDEGPLVRCEQAPRADMQARHYARQENDPRWIDAPAVAAGQALDDG